MPMTEELKVLKKAEGQLTIKKVKALVNAKLEDFLPLMAHATGQKLVSTSLPLKIELKPGENGDFEFAVSGKVNIGIEKDTLSVTADQLEMDI